jgi:hypothetical protein
MASIIKLLTPSSQHQLKVPHDISSKVIKFSKQTEYHCSWM